MERISLLLLLNKRTSLLGAALVSSLISLSATALAAHSHKHPQVKPDTQQSQLQAALQQQHMAQLEVRMQQKLTAKAERLAQHQQLLAMKQHKAHLRMARVASQNHAIGTGNVVMAAYSLRGTRYVMGGTSRSGFDCSGFVRYVLSAADGVAVPRTAAEQYYHGKPIAVQNMEPGDLVFFKNTYKHGISHVGIYAGQGKFIHAANAHKGVRIDVLNSAYYWSHFAGARRVLPAQMRQAAFLR